jgi:broad specificity phosphatase PhoE
MKIFFVRHGLSETNMSKTYSADTTKVPLTKHGVTQAEITGKILADYGVFDLIICSPYLRTIQTADIINKELNVKKILYNDLIIEQYPEILKNFANEKTINSAIKLLKDKEKLALHTKYVDIKDIIKMSKLEEKIKVVTDPFKLFELKKNIHIAYAQMYKHLTPKKIYNNDMKFFKYLKTLKKKCILIVTHGMVLGRFLGIITNTPYYDINFIDNTKPIVNENLYKYYGTSNCCIMGCLYDSSEKQFKLIIPPNILHLKELVDKEPKNYPIIEH